MNSKVFEEARDFAGADWEKLSIVSRERLLSSHGITTAWKSERWRRLSPFVQTRLAESLIRDSREGVVRRK
jgi:hypothetical protein